MRQGRGSAAVILLATGLLLAGCGGAQTLTASEFVERIKGEGVAIELGRKLATSGSAKELYAIDLPPLPGEPKPPPGSEGGPGASGSLYVFGEVGGAEDQLKACQAAGGLICFRASNIVVVLDEESSPLAAQRLALAVKRLAE